MTDDRVCMTMDGSTRFRLSFRARAIALQDREPQRSRAQALLDALFTAEAAGPDGLRRVRCTQEVLAFIRAEMPDIARRWPAVFGQVAPERSDTLAMIGARAVGKAIVGLEIDRLGVARLVLEGGDSIVFDPDGSIDYDDKTLYGCPVVTTEDMPSDRVAVVPPETDR